MRVQALHSRSGTTDSPARSNQVTAQCGRVAASRVVVVRSLEFDCVNQRLEAVHAAVALESTHRRVDLGIYQPEQGGHRRAVSQVRFVLDHDRPTISSSHDYRESTAERATNQSLYELLIVRRRVAKAQRQNSRVCTKRERKPFEW